MSILRQGKDLETEVNLERLIATGMIVSKSFLREMARVHRPGILSVRFIDTVVKWCVEYFEEFKDAPGLHIQDIFRSKQRTIRDAEQLSVIEQFLYVLSEEYAKTASLNVDYLLKEGQEYFRLRSLILAREELGKHILSKRIDEGERVIANYQRMVRPASIGVNPFRDMEYVEDAFNAAELERMFSFRGDLGGMIGDFCRGEFVMVVAPQGRGKTWWLLELAMRGLMRGFDVLFISFEMTQKQMVRRAHHWLNARPSEKWAGPLLLPIFDCVRNQNGTCTLPERVAKVMLMAEGKQMPEYDAAISRGYQSCTVCRHKRAWFSPAVWYTRRDFTQLSFDYASNKAEQFNFQVRGTQLRFVTRPAGEMSNRDLRAMIDNYRYYEGWAPQIVVTDYGDKMAPNDRGEREYRHRLNSIVEGHKSLALDLNILVASGSQSSTGREENKDVGSGAFAESIAKKAEVDRAFSLNQIDLEKRMGVMRIKNMKVRDDYFNASDACIVLQQLKIGKPYLDSCLIGFS